jgi:hypothetical protein
MTTLQPIELARTPQVLWPMDDEFDFRIVGNVRELERLIRGRAGSGRRESDAIRLTGACLPTNAVDESSDLCENSPLLSQRWPRGEMEPLGSEAKACGLRSQSTETR